ncbi:21762_t:CDS:2, partial [Gigaspora rosea]
SFCHGAPTKKNPADCLKSFSNHKLPHNILSNKDLSKEVQFYKNPGSTILQPPVEQVFHSFCVFSLALNVTDKSGHPGNSFRSKQIKQLYPTVKSRGLSRDWSTLI